MLKLFLILVMSFSASLAFSAHIMKAPGDMEFTPGPASLPAGAQMTVLAGHPKDKGPFTIRVKFPANLQIPAHWHSKDENVTVMDGVLYMGEGDKLDESAAHSLPLHGYVSMPAKTHHFAFTKEEGAIVQLHGMGPFDITYINPKDDPRKQK